MTTVINTTDEAFLLALPSLRHHAEQAIIAAGADSEVAGQAAIIHGFLDDCARMAGIGILQSSCMATDAVVTPDETVDIGGDGPIHK